MTTHTIPQATRFLRPLATCALLALSALAPNGAAHAQVAPGGTPAVAKPQDSKPQDSKAQDSKAQDSKPQVSKPAPARGAEKPPATADRPKAPTTPPVPTAEVPLSHDAAALALLKEASAALAADRLGKAKCWRVELETERIVPGAPTTTVTTDVTWFSPERFVVKTRGAGGAADMAFGRDSKGGWQLGGGGITRLPVQEIMARGEGFRSLELFMDPARFLTAQFAKIEQVPGAVVVAGTPAVLVRCSQQRPGAIGFYREMTLAIDPSTKRVVGHGTNTGNLADFSQWSEWQQKDGYAFAGLTQGFAKGQVVRRERWKAIEFDAAAPESLEMNDAPAGIAR